MVAHHRRKHQPGAGVDFVELAQPEFYRVCGRSASLSARLEVAGQKTTSLHVTFTRQTAYLCATLALTMKLHLSAGSKSTVHPSYDRRKVTNFFTSVFSEIVVPGARKSNVSHFA